MREHVHFVISWLEPDNFQYKSREVTVVETTKRTAVEFKIGRNVLIQLYNFYDPQHNVTNTPIDFTHTVRVHYLLELMEICKWREFELLQLPDREELAEDLAHHKKLGEKFNQHHPINLWRLPSLRGRNFHFQQYIFYL